MRRILFLISFSLVLLLLVALSVPVLAARPSTDCECACCTESVNPSGKNIPPAGWSTEPGTNPNSGKNPDGFYKLGPDCPSSVVCISYVGAEGSCVTTVPSGVTVKFTEAPGISAPMIKKMGSANGKAWHVYAHIILPADPVITVMYNCEFICASICPVPPPPK